MINLVSKLNFLILYKVNDEKKINAIKQRLATAKVQASAASKSLVAAKETKNYAEVNMDIAKKMLDSANKDVVLSQNQYDISQKELQDAEKCLADAQASLQAKSADVQKNVSSNLQQPNEDSNKKREAPSAGSDFKREDSIKKRKTTEMSSNGTSPVRQTVQLSGSDNSIAQDKEQSASQSTSSSSPISINQIYIKGCGNAEINGTYNRELTLHNGAFIYTKNEEVVWHEESVFFSIYRDYNSAATKFVWYIGNAKHKNMSIFKSDLNVNSAIPPQRGWVIAAGTECGGLYPVPYCRHIRHQNKTQSTTVRSNIDTTREQRIDQTDKDSTTKHTAATGRKSSAPTMTIKSGHPSTSRPSTVIEIGKSSPPTKTIRVEQRPSSGAAAMFQDEKCSYPTKEAVESEQATTAPPPKTEGAVPPPVPFYDESIDWTCTCGKVVPRTKKRCSECNKWRGGKRAPYETKVSMMKKVAPATIKLDAADANTIDQGNWICTNCQNEVYSTKSRCGKCHRWRGGKRKGGWKIKVSAVDESGIEWDKDWTCCDLIIPAAKKRCGKCNGWRGGKRVAAKKQEYELNKIKRPRSKDGIAAAVAYHQSFNSEYDTSVNDKVDKDKDTTDTSNSHQVNHSSPIIIKEDIKVKVKAEDESTDDEYNSEMRC